MIITEKEQEVLKKLKGTKEGAVLRHMILKKDGITGDTAYTEYHLYRLAGAIHKLKHIHGMDIVTVPEGKQGYARYKMARHATPAERGEL